MIDRRHCSSLKVRANQEHERIARLDGVRALDGAGAVLVPLIAAAK